MNITPNLLPNLGRTEEPEEFTDEQRREVKRRDRLERKRLGLDLGPRATRSYSNGQVRRAQVRRAETERRKANLRHRRTWMTNRLQEAKLLGMVRHAEDQTPLGANARQGLLYAFRGDVDGLVETQEQALAYAREIAEPIITRRALARMA